MNLEKKDHGGARPGAGRRKGAKMPKTLAKEAARELLREGVFKQLDAMVEAQIANALGIKYLVVRQKSSGKFIRVTEAMAKARKDLAPDEEIIEVWEKDPSVQAFTDLMNRAIDKPKEQEQEIKLSGSVDLIQVLQAGRVRAANAKKQA